MPRITFVAPNGELDVADAKAGSIHVMGIYNNGANGAVLQQDTTAVIDVSYAYNSATKKITMPGTATGAPDQYIVKYDRDMEAGIRIANTADKFPDTIKLTLYAAIMDPCSDTYKSAYIVLPSFQPDPSTTISFDSDTQEVNFNGNLQVNFCSCDKSLYYIYFDGEDAVVGGTCA